MDGISMSLTNWHQIKVRTSPVSSRTKRVCDSIRRCSNQAKYCDGLAWQYTVDRFYNEMPAVEYIVGILGNCYSSVTLQSHMDPNQIRNCLAIHSRPPPQHPSAHEFVLDLVYFQYHLYLVRQNYLALADVSVSISIMEKNKPSIISIIEIILFCV